MGILNWFARRKVEAPADKAGGAMAAAMLLASPYIDSRRSLGVPAFNRALSYVGDNFAQLPIILTKDGVPQEAGSYLKVLDLLNVGRGYNAHTLKAGWVIQSKLYGNGYLGIVRDNRGTPLYLQPLDARKILPFTIDGYTFFYFSQCPLRELDPNQVEALVRHNPRNILDGSDILHLANTSIDGVKGLGILDYLKDSMANAKAIEDFIGKYFANSTFIKSVLTYDGELTEAQKAQIKKSIDAFKGYGSAQAFSTLLVEYGGKFENFPVNADVAQLIENKKMSILDCANVTGVQASILNPDYTKYTDPQKARVDVYNQTFAGPVSQAEIQYLKLLSEKERLGGFAFTHRVDYLDPSYDTQLSNNVQNEYKAGIRTRNEARKVLGLPSVAHGDAFLVPAGASEASDASERSGEANESQKKPAEKPQQTPLAPQPKYTAFMPVISALCEKVDGKTIKAFENRQGKPQEELIPWANVFSEEQRQYATDTLEAIESTIKNFGYHLETKQMAQRYADAIKRKASGGESITLLNLTISALKGE